MLNLTTFGSYENIIFIDLRVRRPRLIPESSCESSRWRKITRDSIYNVLNDMNLVMNGEVLSKTEQKSLVRLFSRSSEYQCGEHTYRQCTSGC